MVGIRLTPRKRFLSGPARLRQLLAPAELTPDRAARVAFILATGARWWRERLARRPKTLQTRERARGAARDQDRASASRTVPIVGAGHDLIDHVPETCRGREPRCCSDPGATSRRDLVQACRRASGDRSGEAPATSGARSGRGCACTAWRRTHRYSSHADCWRMVERVCGANAREPAPRCSGHVEPRSRYVATVAKGRGRSESLGRARSPAFSGIFLECPGTELNRRHEDFQSSALPTELPGRVPRGFEPSSEGTDV